MTNIPKSVETTDSTVIHERGRWRAGEKITLTYAVESAETVWIQVEITSYQFEHQFRLRRTALGELIAPDARFI